MCGCDLSLHFEKVIASLLQSPAPIARAALGMSNGYNLNVVKALTEDHEEWMSIKKGSARTKNIRGAYERGGSQLQVGSVEFFLESEGGRKTSIP